MFRSLMSVFLLSLLLCLSLLLQSCGGSGSSGGPDSSGETGNLVLKLTDASTDDFQAIYVTIAEVWVHGAADAGEDDSGWQLILTPEKTYNLLELVNGVFATLGIAELETGQYGQMRLILGEEPDNADNILAEQHPFANYLIDSDDSYKELKVPSGFQSGIKIVKGFTIENSVATELILDFNAERSVVQAGKSGKWLLKPTIKILETVMNSIAGEILDGAEPVEGALVSAQLFDAGAVDPKDEVIVESTTVSSAAGTYLMYLPPDTYNIIVVKDGFLPACQEVEAQFYEAYSADFSLVREAGMITISGNVAGLSTDEEVSTLSARQHDVNCGGAVDTTIEIAGVNAANGDYAITLPVGTYDLVASAPGEITQVFEAISVTTTVDIVFGL